MFDGIDYALKRSFDLVVATIGLVVISPLLLVIALAIKLSSRGPVLYRSVRPGMAGRPFSCLKFRTMREHADQIQADLEPLNEKSGALFKIRNDPRLTRVGRALRRFSLDELPQLWNVLRGEMSLVGPRPLPMRDFERLEEWHKKRYLVLPGITGLWQVSGALGARLRRPGPARLPVPGAVVGVPGPVDPAQDHPGRRQPPRRVLGRLRRRCRPPTASSSRSPPSRPRRAALRALGRHAARALPRRRAGAGERG